MARNVSRTVVSRSSSHILGWVLTVSGFTPIFIVLINAWISGISFLNLSALFDFLWTKQFYIGFGIGLQLIYLILIGAIAITSGLFLLARKKEEIKEVTLIADDLKVTVECKACKHRWEEHFSKEQLKSMGFPQNRTISRRKCLVCGRFTRPKITSI